MIDFEDEFISVTHEYLSASAALAEATSLCEDDPVKQDMIAFIQPDFIKMCARSEGIRLMAEKSYIENRNFILEEMKEVTILNLEMAQKIKHKLTQLDDLCTLI